MCIHIPYHSGVIPLWAVLLNKTEQLSAWSFSNATRSSAARYCQCHYFNGWYIWPFSQNREERRPHSVLTRAEESSSSTGHCNFEGSGPFLGNNTCVLYTMADPPFPVNGTYWICGLRVYPWLPGLPAGDFEAWQRPMLSRECLCRIISGGNGHLRCRPAEPYVSGFHPV